MAQSRDVLENRKMKPETFRQTEHLICPFSILDALKQQVACLGLRGAEARRKHTMVEAAQKTLKPKAVCLNSRGAEARRKHTAVETKQKR